MKRVNIIVGHYGSGKTEIAINMALKGARDGRNMALVDLDIANPYFRSREQQGLLEEAGVQVYSNAFGYDITADLPALGANIRSPIENEGITTIIDVGGNDSGARVLHQFLDCYNQDHWAIYPVVNGNRPETDEPDKARKFIEDIEREIELKATAIINNTHLLTETTLEDVVFGHDLCRQVSDHTGIPILADCCTYSIYEELKTKIQKREVQMEISSIWPIEILMRQPWMDR